MIINHNLMAMNTYNKLTTNNAAASKSLEKLSSGLRINRAGDDAAGLAISEKMRGQIRGLDQAGSNSQNGISLIQTAEGALSETHSILQRMRELAVQSASDTNTDDDRAEIQKEVAQLKGEVNRIAYNTEFNTKKLLNGDLDDKSYVAQTAEISSKTGSFTASVTALTVNTVSSSDAYDIQFDGYNSSTKTYTYHITRESTGSTFASGTISGSSNAAVGTITVTATNAQEFTISVSAANVNLDDSITFLTRAVKNATAVQSQSLTLQVGANSSQTISLGIGNMDTKSLNIDKVNVSTAERATMAIASIDEAIKNVSSERSKMGAVQNRLEHTITNLETASENISSAESRIRDVDMAKEMMNYQKTSILQQAATSMLAQANQQPQNVLKLLQ